jgi:hypothetical protein
MALKDLIRPAPTPAADCPPASRARSTRAARASSASTSSRAARAPCRTSSSARSDRSTTAQRARFQSSRPRPSSKWRHRRCRLRRESEGGWSRPGTGRLDEERCAPDGWQAVLYRSKMNPFLGELRGDGLPHASWPPSRALPPRSRRPPCPTWRDGWRGSRSWSSRAGPPVFVDRQL